MVLAGVTVVSIEQAVAAPFATRQLAELGARVIKIERPDGGDFARGYDTAVNGLSSYFVWLNRSKESMALDVKSAGGREVLDRLIARADVFVHNLAPGAADRLGLSAGVLRERDDRLITCAISGYGASGPFASRKAYDLLVQNEVGLVSLTGSPDAPSRVGISVADIAAGMYAFSAVLSALLARGQTGRGASLDVSLFDALAEWMGAPALYAFGTGRSPERTAAAHPTIAPYEPFVAGDGVAICIAIQNPREWTRFCSSVVDRGDLADDPRFRTNPLRVQHRQALHDVIAGIIAGIDSATLCTRLDAAEIGWARTNDLAGFLNHPQILSRGRWREVGSPAGLVPALVPPVRIDGQEPRLGPVPALGEHTAAILHELGYAPAAIAAFRREGSI